MPDKPDAGEPFFTLYGGVKVHASDMLPDNMIAFKEPGRRPVFFAVDPGSAEGDYSVVQVHPRLRIDKGLLDGITADELLAGERASLELEAARRAADLYALGERLMFPNSMTTTESRWPERGRPFRLEDMNRIMEDMERKRHDGNVKLVEALVCAGFTVTVNNVTEKPIAVLPETFQSALDEVLGDRDNRDPAENFYRAWAYWPDRWPSDYMDELRDGMSPAEFKRLYQQEFPLDDEQDIGG